MLPFAPFAPQMGCRRGNASFRPMTVSVESGGRSRYDAREVMLKTQSGLAALAILLAPLCSARADVSDCYDAVVKARIARQIPSEYPECGDDCIVITWPWFLELNVKRVVAGQAATGKMVTLAMLHTNYRRNLGARRWWLRRNTLGGFNLLRYSEDADLPRCSADAQPARPFLSPRPGETLDSLMRDSNRAYKAQQ